MKYEEFANLDPKVAKDESSNILLSKKKACMHRLYKTVDDLDKKGNVKWEDEKNRIVVNYNEKGDGEKKFICNYKNKEYKLSLGDIMADYGWGVKYMPEENMPDDMYRGLAKRILTNEARRDIELIYNKESEKEFHLKDYHNEDFHSQGILSEKMIIEFMTRVSYVLSGILDIDMKIIRASEEEDLRKKIDFKIIFIEHKRGVKTVDEGELRDYDKNFRKLGLQVAVAGSRGKGINSRDFQRYLLTKKAKIEIAKRRYKDILDVDDIVLVAFRIKQSRELYYDKWLRDGKPPGGPEQYMALEKKKEVFKIVTQGFKLDIPDDTLEKILK